MPWQQGSGGNERIDFSLPALGRRAQQGTFPRVSPGRLCGSGQGALLAGEEVGQSLAREGRQISRIKLAEAHETKPLAGVGPPTLLGAVEAYPTKVICEASDGLHRLHHCAAMSVVTVLNDTTRLYLMC